MNLRALGFWIFLLSTAFVSRAFEPDYDEHISLSPTNIAALGGAFHYYSNVSAVEITLPQKFRGAPFKDARLYSETKDQFLQVPIQAEQEKNKVLIGFWMDPKSLHTSSLRITFRKPGALAGVQFHLAFRSFTDEQGRPHNERAAGDGGIPLLLHAERAWPAAPHHERP